MKTALLSLQQAIYNQLINDSALMSKVTGVFDDVPQGTSMPYVALGDDTVNDWPTKTRAGEEMTHTLHVWSDYNGKKEVKEIMNLVLQAMTTKPLTMSTQSGTMYLDQPDVVTSESISVTGFHMVVATLDFMNDFVDIDGEARHGVIRFRFLIQN